jgi:dTDP-4-amino-4,6-dideoxygalactose transaminase
VIRAPRRDELRTFLTERGIGTAVYYPIPLHLQECFSDLGYRSGDLPHAEAAAHQTLALPIYPGLTSDQQTYVVESVAAFYREVQ